MKHYIRVDKNICVTKVFGGHQEIPLQSDIFYQETNDHIHPLSRDIVNEKGFYKWAWDGSELVPASLDLQIEKVKLDKLSVLDQQAQTSILTAYPIPKQLNIHSLGLNKATSSNYLVADQDEMRQYIDSIRTKLAGLEEQVTAATTAAQVEALTW
jgi:hypothetical protein